MGIPPRLRLLTSTLLELFLTLPYSKTAQPLKVLAGVVPPTGWCAPGQRERTESLTEPQPARGYAKLVGGFADCERVSSSKHAPNVELTDRFGETGYPAKSRLKAIITL
jgi:hypothetical protein